ncbi:MAG: hypothetical protein ACU843_17850, partial [Gammaproteobacteria bacterium]
MRPGNDDTIASLSPGNRRLSLLETVESCHFAPRTRTAGELRPETIRGERFVSILVTGGAGFIGSNFVLDWAALS